MAQGSVDKDKQVSLLSERDLSDAVMKRVRSLETGKALVLPPNYSPENALKEAYLIIKQTIDKNGAPALSVCTRDSITTALLDMVLQGLNPMKSQCYFIVHGNELKLRRSYFGTERALRTVLPETDKVVAVVVHQGDEVEYEIGTDINNPNTLGEKIVTKHKQSLANMDNPIVAVYGYITKKDGKLVTTDMMTANEIFAAWRKSQTRVFNDQGGINATSTHGQFPVEMAKKTLLNRMCKRPFKATDDSVMIEQQQAFARTTENEYDGVDIESEYEIPNDKQKPLGPQIPKQEPKQLQVQAEKQDPSLSPEVGDIASLFGPDDGKPF